MNKEIFEVMKKVQAEGYKIYLVGGFVRDYYLKKETNDIDMATNAKIKVLEKIFKKEEYTIAYNCLSFKKNGFLFQITPYRKEGKYNNHRYPDKIKYTRSLKKDSNRRDFTCNSIYLTSNLEYIDYHNGMKDINDKVLKAIGSSEKKLKEDSLRILRTIRLAMKLNFKIDDKLSKAIMNNKVYLKELSYTRKYEELEKMFYIDEEKLYSYIDKYDLYDSLEINKNVKKTGYIEGFWYQTNYYKYPIPKEILKIIKKIELYINKDLTKDDLFNLDLKELKILSILRNLDYSKLKEIKQNIKIEDINDLCLDYNYLKQKKYNISKIKEDILHKVINEELENNYQKIIAYIENNYS